MSIGHYDPLAMSPAEYLRRFTIDEYYKMAEIGALDPDERVELLEGLIYEKHSPSLLPRRFTIEEYHRLAEGGILKPDERVELIDGVIYTMSPIGSRHAWCVDTLAAFFAAAVGRRAIVRVQNPIQLPDQTEPQPDLSLLRPRPDRYRDRHPGPGDILLVVEVMETSALRDRGQKLTAYAKAGIPEVWLVDLDSEFIEVHTDPGGPVYGRAAARGRGASVAPAELPDVALSIDDLFA